MALLQRFHCKMCKAKKKKNTELFLRPFFFKHAAGGRLFIQAKNRCGKSFLPNSEGHLLKVVLVCLFQWILIMSGHKT